MQIKLWDKQERTFAGYTWPTDQDGNPITWESPWLYLYGSTGSGKTTYARTWVQTWNRWEFTNAVEFIEHLRAAAGNQQTVTYYLRTLGTYPRMVIDDLGSEPTDHFNNFGTRYTPAEIFETALFRRHEYRLRTLITSNLNLDSLKKQYGPKIHSRVLELATIYNLRGDRRLRQPVECELISKSDATTDVPLKLTEEEAGPQQMTKAEFMAEREKLGPEARRFVDGLLKKHRIPWAKGNRRQK